jgi:hypothetical protein
MVNDVRVEELLIQTNPVLDPEELRLTAPEVDARCASILEGRGDMKTETPTAVPEWIPPSRRRRRPALAFVVGLFVVIVAAAGVVLLVGGGDSEVADETTIGVIRAPVYANVPPFSGVVEFYEHDPALDDPGWHATLGIEHSGPMLYEAEVLSGGPPYLGGVGARLYGDGTTTWVSEGPSAEPSQLSDLNHLRSLFYDSASPCCSWSEICADGALLGTETVLERTTSHVACSTTMEDYELWVDEETGVVLKLAGPLGQGDFFPYADRDGGFVFTELELGSVIAGAAPFSWTPPEESEVADSGDYPEPKGVGEKAPVWSGPRIGGGEFNLADYRHPSGKPEDGSFVIVFDWFPACGDGCFEGLDLMQYLYDSYGQTDWTAETGGYRVQFVTVSEDVESETSRLLERGSNTVPAVFCRADYNAPACATPELGIHRDASPWSLWGNGVPSTTVIDVRGTVVQAYLGRVDAYAGELGGLLAQIAGVQE